MPATLAYPQVLGKRCSLTSPAWTPWPYVSSWTSHKLVLGLPRSFPPLVQPLRAHQWLAGHAVDSLSAAFACLIVHITRGGLMLVGQTSYSLQHHASKF